ncbi:MAG: polysaccharide export protein [Planctomycetes bacterium]|jgi:polysaccharide export outer membrane protein|nr:polysaccharide export protein [Planctomycetota bacterium]
MIFSRFASLFIAAALFAACSSPEISGGANPDDLPTPSVNTFDYLVGPGDVLRVNVAGHPALSSGPYRNNAPGSPVDGQGSIQLPYLGSLIVSGKTVHEIKADLQTRLLEYLKRPFVDVSVVEFGSQRIYVMGEVRKPGSFTFDRPITAMQALSLTGGFTDDANREQVALVRGDVTPENIVLFDAEHLNSGGDFALASGDMLFISRHKWAGVGAVARDLIPILQLISVPVGTARDVALFEDIRSR